MFYMVAMGVDAVAALVCGWLFDRPGFTVLAAVMLVSLPALMAFSVVAQLLAVPVLFRVSRRDEAV